MLGNLISNRQISKLMKENVIAIEPFDPFSLKATHYTLHPGRVLCLSGDGRWIGRHDFTENPNPYTLNPEEYVVVEPREQVKIRSEGLIGRFMTTSTLIESGLLVVAGQIDNKYGTEHERLRFGLKNLFSERHNELKSETRLVHVKFFDLRAITMDTVVLTPEEDFIRARRRYRATDDGVSYENENEE